MKYIVVILLLNTNGIDVDKKKIKYNGAVDTCNRIAESWVDVNTKYYDERNGNPKLQGYYTKKGKLLLGWICN